jgi:hypothetical protein
MIHVIPDHESDQHEESPDCICAPAFILDDESGEMVWMHQIMSYDKLVDDLVIL